MQPPSNLPFGLVAGCSLSLSHGPGCTLISGMVLSNKMFGSNCSVLPISWDGPDEQKLCPGGLGVKKKHVSTLHTASQQIFQRVVNESARGPHTCF